MYDDGSYDIIGACIEVHRGLGPGLLESAYQRSVARELEHLGIPFEREPFIAIRYRDIVIERAFQPDFIVDGRIVLELKAVSAFHDVHRVQLRTYVRLAKARAGLMINFNAALIKDDAIFRFEGKED